MTMQQLAILTSVVGFVVIGLILFAAYKVAEHKDMKALKQAQNEASKSSMRTR